MALKKCKECGREVSSKAKSCPGCGYDLTKAGAGQTALGCLVLIFFLYLGFSAIGSFVDALPEAPPWDEQDNWSGAYVMTEGWVKERLVSPASADFPGASTKRSHTQKVNGQLYRIQSYVDSQNRMGAMIRTHFTAEVEQVEEGTWQLRKLDLHE